MSFTVLSPEYLKWIYDIPSSNQPRNPYDLSNVQLYNPLYSRIFPNDVTPENYNSITWPNHLQMCGIDAVTDVSTGAFHQRPTFIKFSPLLDPLRYLIGKYDLANPALRILPNLDNKDDVHSKIGNQYNVSYIDAFMCYLSSQLATRFHFCHGLDYYGSYLAIQKHFRYNAVDDIDYLSDSSFFVDHLGHEFSMDMDETQLKCGSRGCKHKIHILDKDEAGLQRPLNITLGTLDDVFVDDVVATARPDVDSGSGSDELASLHSIGSETCMLSDIGSVSPLNSHPASDTENDMMDCDSVLNYTDTSNPDIDDPTLDDLEILEDMEGGECDDGSTEYTELSEDAELDAEGGDDESEWEEDEDDEDDYDDEEEQVNIYIQNFPTQMICLGKCDGTLDELMVRGEIDDAHGSAWLFQIIMSLLVYQTAFQFTHNDLHTNNIMYVETDVKHLDYVYNGVKYRVPTYGKLFKIIDFGRAIYRFNGMVFCSDCYAPCGDAYSQYNCEPFFNPNLKRVDPNPSFDLCRLACSMYLMLNDDDEENTKELQKTIQRWCLDDNGKNVVLKKNGEERYPNFKLYKMIARHVHAHTPENQLSFPFFSQYALSSDAKPPKNWMALGMDVDAVPKLSGSFGENARPDI
jgi:hypothetical protein